MRITLSAPPDARELPSGLQARLSVSSGLGNTREWSSFGFQRRMVSSDQYAPDAKVSPSGLQCKAGNTSLMALSDRSRRAVPFPQPDHAMLSSRRQRVALSIRGNDGWFESIEHPHEPQFIGIADADQSAVSKSANAIRCPSGCQHRESHSVGFNGVLVTTFHGPTPAKRLGFERIPGRTLSPLTHFAPTIFPSCPFPEQSCNTSPLPSSK